MKTRQFVIYSRKSKFTGKGESIENQIELCRQYIADHFSRVEAEKAFVYEDEGFSGGNLERPQFKEMMKDSKTNNFAAIVVYRLDRISRNIGDFAKLIEDLSRRNIDFISIKEQFDTSSPMGRAMMYIASVFSQLERETIAERIRDNMHELAKTGRWLGGNTPMGYKSKSVTNVSVEGKTKKSCMLEIIPEEIGLIKLVFDKFLEFNSLTKVDQYLLSNHYKTRKNNSFTRFTIRCILSNPVYMIADEDAYKYFTGKKANLFSNKEDFDGVHGIMSYNRTLQTSGKSTIIKPITEWIVSVGKHEGVIPGSTWIQVQNILEINKTKSPRRARVNKALLSGVLFCKNCGDFMRPKLTKRLNKSGEAIYPYMCQTKERSRGHVCNMKNVNGNTLDELIINELKQLGTNDSEMVKNLTQAKKKIRESYAEYEQETATIKNKIEQNENSIKKLLISLGNVGGSSAEKYIIEQVEELHSENETLKKRLIELEAAAIQQELLDTEFNKIKQLLLSFSESFDSYSIEQKRTAIRTLVKKIVWDGENIHLFLFGSVEGFDFSEILDPSCEDRKFYPITTESNNGYQHSKKWRLFCRLDENIFLMVQHRINSVKFSPLFLHKISLDALSMSKFNLDSISDKLKFFRLKNGLCQEEAAKLSGLSRYTYIRYERAGQDNYTFDNLKKIASLYKIHITEILSDYYLFLYNNQGTQIKAKRYLLNMTQKEYADFLNVPLGSLKRWEQNRSKMGKETWEKHFKE